MAEDATHVFELIILHKGAIPVTEIVLDRKGGDISGSRKSGYYPVYICTANHSLVSVRVGSSWVDAYASAGHS